MNELNKILRKRVSKKISKTPEEIIPEATEYTAEKQIERSIQIRLWNTRKKTLLDYFFYGQNEMIFEEEDENKQTTELKIKVAELIVQDLKKDEISFQNSKYELIINEYASGIEKENISLIKSISVCMRTTLYQKPVSTW